MRTSLLASACLVLAGASTLQAEDRGSRSGSAGSDGPLVVAAVAGVDRMLECTETVGSAVERPGYPVLARGLIGSFGDLKGIDRTRPAGMLLYLDPGEVPQPGAVWFVPLSDPGVFRNGLMLGPVQVEKPEAGTGRYHVRVAGRRMPMVVRRRYAFVALRAATLKRSFEEPVRLAGSLTKRFDAALSVRLEHFPADLRHLLLDYLRAEHSERIEWRLYNPVERRRRIDELTKFFDLLERVLADAKEATLGGRLDDSGRLEAEFTLTGRRESRLPLFRPSDVESPTPLTLTGRGAAILKLLPDELVSEMPLGRGLLDRAFRAGDDEFRVELDRLENGVRLNFDMGEGFVRLFTFLLTDGG